MVNLERQMLFAIDQDNSSQDICQFLLDQVTWSVQVTNSSEVLICDIQPLLLILGEWGITISQPRFSLVHAFTLLISAQRASVFSSPKGRYLGSGAGRTGIYSTRFMRITRKWDSTISVMVNSVFREKKGFP